MLLYAAWFMEDPSDYSLGLPKWYMDTTKLTCLKNETPFPNHHLYVNTKNVSNSKVFACLPVQSGMIPVTPVTLKLDAACISTAGRRQIASAGKTPAKGLHPKIISRRPLGNGYIYIMTVLPT